MINKVLHPYRAPGLPGWLSFSLVVLSFVLSGCGVPQSPTVTHEVIATISATLFPTTQLPTATTAAPSATRTPTALPMQTLAVTRTLTASRTRVPTDAPYVKIPEQTDDGWQTASLAEAGINPVRINRMVGYIYRGDKKGDTPYLPNGKLKYENIHGILIVKDGLLVFEEYFYHYYRGNRHNTASVTKSITSLLVGLAIEQGYLTGVDEKILPYFPEYLPPQLPDELKEEITIEDLLTMRHGLECDDWDPDSPTYHEKDFPYHDPDAIAATFDLPMLSPPGSQFSYCSASTIILGEVIARATGMSVGKYARENLFDPLNISFATWMTAPGGFIDAGGGMEMLPRDMARLGLLVLQKGNWNGRQVVSADWLYQSTQEQVSLDFNSTWGNGYGYLWWLSDVPIAGTHIHSLAASGAGGQVITVFPDLNMVVVITGGNYHNDEGYPFQLMEKFILPAALQKVNE